MFRRLAEMFEDTPQNVLNENIVRYSSVEPNFITFNTNQNYAFPNPGIQSQQQQQSNTALQNSLSNLNAVPNAFVGGTTTNGLGDVPAIFTGIPDTIGKNLEECRTYTGLTGLSNMIGNTTNPQAANRCGWRYKPGAGSVPELAQGAFGTNTGPLDPADPKKDKVGNGIQYFWNLADAEKTMMRDLCKSANGCLDMAGMPALGDFSNVCGYCTSSQRVIPIKRDGSRVSARYTDVDLQCAPQNIILPNEAQTKCPQPPPGTPEAPYLKCLRTGKLERDCLTLAANYAGCSPGGTMIQALNSGKNQLDLADDLRKKKSFQVYQSLANPVLSEDVLKDGNATMYSAFMSFYNVNRNQYTSDNEKLFVAARDLCTSSGFFDSYNFCADLTDNTRDFEVNCMQKEFLRQGGTTGGTDYPNDKSKAQGMTWGEYKKSVETLVTDSKNINEPNKQRSALNRLSGLGLQLVPTNLPRGEQNQGVEIFWFDTNLNVVLGRRPTLSATNSNLPNFNVGGGIVQDTGLIDNVSFVSICDLRPTATMQLAFGAVTDDGFIYAINQNPFKITDPSKSLNRWYDQGPTWHNGNCIQIQADSTQRPNILTWVWYEKGGGAVFHPYYTDCTTNQGWKTIGATGQAVDPTWKDICYFSQEIDAPSLSFQVYNDDNQATFMERRLNFYIRGAADRLPSLVKVIGDDLPSDTMAMILASNKYTCSSQIALSAFRTITVCFSITSVDTQARIVFNLGNVGVLLAKKLSESKVEISFVCRDGSQRFSTTRILGTIPIETWTMATIIFEPNSKFTNAISNVKAFIQTVKNLKQGRILDGVQLFQYSHNVVLYDDYKNNKNSRGNFVLGEQGMTARYAWVHFFDDAWDVNDSSKFKKEVTGGWVGRWWN